MDAFTSTVFEIFIMIATFDLLENIPEELWYLDLMGLYDEYFEMPEGEPMNPQFEAVGLDSPFFIYNMGTVMLQIILVTVILMLSALYKQCMYRHKWFKKQWKKSGNSAFWNLPIFLVQENFGILTLAGLLTVVDPEYWNRWSTWGEIIQTFLGTAWFFLICFFPLIVIYWMWINFEKFGNEHFEEKYGALYESCYHDRREVILYRAVYLGRRMAIALICVFSDTFVYQLLVFFIQQNAVIIIFGLDIFSTREKWARELLNELMIMICGYHIMCFS